MQCLTEIQKDINNQSMRQKPWTENYIHQMLRCDRRLQCHSAGKKDVVHSNRRQQKLGNLWDCFCEYIPYFFLNLLTSFFFFFGSSPTLFVIQQVSSYPYWLSVPKEKKEKSSVYDIVTISNYISIHLKLVNFIFNINKILYVKTCK